MRLMIKITQRVEGFTLIEVLGMVVLLGLLSIPLIGGLGQGMWTISDSAERDKAIQIGQGTMEMLSALSYEELYIISSENIHYSPDMDGASLSNYELSVEVYPAYQLKHNTEKSHFGEELLFYAVQVTWQSHKKDEVIYLKSLQSSR